MLLIIFVSFFPALTFVNPISNWFKNSFWCEKSFCIIFKLFSKSNFFLLIFSCFISFSSRLDVNCSIFLLALDIFSLIISILFFSTFKSLFFSFFIFSKSVKLSWNLLILLWHNSSNFCFRLSDVFNILLKSPCISSLWALNWLTSLIFISVLFKFV